jgi:hypothetical protein
MTITENEIITKSQVDVWNKKGPSMTKQLVDYSILKDYKLVVSQSFTGQLLALYQGRQL